MNTSDLILVHSWLLEDFNQTDASFDLGCRKGSYISPQSCCEECNRQVSQTAWLEPVESSGQDEEVGCWSTCLFVNCLSPTASVTESAVVAAIIIAVRIVASAASPVASSAPSRVHVFGLACIYRTGHFMAVGVVEELSVVNCCRSTASG